MPQIKDLALYVGLWTGTAYFFEICDPKVALLCSISTVAGYSFATRIVSDNYQAQLIGYSIGLHTTNAFGYDLRLNNTRVKLELAFLAVAGLGQAIQEAFNRGLDPAQVELIA